MCRSYHRDSTDTQYAIIHKSLKSSNYTLNLYNNVPFIFWVFMTNGLIVAINPTSCCPYQEKVASSYSIALCRVFGHENSQKWRVCTYRELYFWLFGNFLFGIYFHNAFLSTKLFSIQHSTYIFVSHQSTVSAQFGHMYMHTYMVRRSL